MSYSDIESLKIIGTYLVILCFFSGFMGLYVAIVLRSLYRWVDRRYLFFPAATRAFRRRATARREVATYVRERNA